MDPLSGCARPLGRGAALSIAAAAATLFLATAVTAKSRAHGTLRPVHSTRAYNAPVTRTPSQELSVTGPHGRIIGADPDPAIRFELRRDSGGEYRSGSPM
jgi:hypothetical protein